MTRTEWKFFQRQLKLLRHYTGIIDGIRGPLTEAAILAFQKEKNLTENGDLTTETKRELSVCCPDYDTSVETAAQLIALAYKVKKKGLAKINETLRADHNVRIIDQCDEPGVEAYLLNNGFLLVPGSNSVWDYLKFNLRIRNFGMPKLRFKSRTGVENTHVDSRGITWHQGFFTHANYVRKWIETEPGREPILIVGHSLGAASAQILSTIWTTPSIGFAAPRLRKSELPEQYKNLSLSICRIDDLVCRYPKEFERLGKSVDLKHNKPRFGLNHNMKAYISAMENPAEGVSVPATWDAKSG